jgi:hypothetical protein
MGAVPLNKNSILLFGGWSKTATQSAFILNQQPSGDNTFQH